MVRLLLTFCISVLINLELASEIARSAALATTPFMSEGGTIFPLDVECNTPANSTFEKCFGMWTCSQAACKAYMFNGTEYAGLRLREQQGSEKCREDGGDALSALWNGTLGIKYRLFFRWIMMLILVSIPIQAVSVLLAKWPPCGSLRWSIGFVVAGKLCTVFAAIINIRLTQKLEENDPPPTFSSWLALASHIVFLVAFLLEAMSVAWEIWTVEHEQEHSAYTAQQLKDLRSQLTNSENNLASARDTASSMSARNQQLEDQLKDLNTTLTTTSRTLSETKNTLTVKIHLLQRAEEDLARTARSLATVTQRNETLAEEVREARRQCEVIVAELFELLQQHGRTKPLLR